MTHLHEQTFDDPKIWVTGKLINKKPLISNLHKTSARLFNCCPFLHSRFNNFSLSEGISTSLDDGHGRITSAKGSESASRPNVSAKDRSWKLCRSTTSCRTRTRVMKAKIMTFSERKRFSETKRFSARKKKTSSRSSIKKVFILCFEYR